MSRELTDVARHNEADALDVARRWREAVESNNMPLFRSLYHPDAVIWTNLDRATLGVEEHLLRVAGARAKAEHWEYPIGLRRARAVLRIEESLFGRDRGRAKRREP